MDFTPRQIQRLTFAAQKLEHGDKQFQHQTAKLGHQNVDLNKAKFPRYKDPIKDTVFDDDFYAREFSGHLADGAEKGDN